MNRTIKLFLLLSAFFIFSCDSIVDGRKGDTFRANKNLWQEQNVESYTFEFNKLCYCGGLFNSATIVVKADSVHAVLDNETGEPLRDPQNKDFVFPKYSESFLTIDELFDVIEKARQQADELNVVYNNQRGYPENIEIDYSKEAIDDEVTYKVGDLKSGQ